MILIIDYFLLPIVYLKTFVIDGFLILEYA